MNLADTQKRNAALRARFAKCEEWHDAEQWDILGQMYFSAGYVLNAGVCFQRADACRQALQIPLVILPWCQWERAGRDFDGCNGCIASHVPVAVETERVHA